MLTSQKVIDPPSPSRLHRKVTASQGLRRGERHQSVCIRV